MALQIRDTFDVDVDTLRNRAFLVEDDQRRNHREGMGFRTYRLVSEDKPPDGRVERVIQVDPGNLPGPLQKALGDVDGQVRPPEIGGRVAKAMEAMTQDSQAKSTPFTRALIEELA
jgi:hypothetical protein